MAELKKRHEFWLTLLIVVLFVGFAWRSDEFLTLGNSYDLVNNYVMLTILACGLFVVLTSDGIDIPFPAMTIITRYGMMLLLQKIGGNFAVAFTLAGCVDILPDLINALLVDRLRVPPIIVTTSTLDTFYGLLLWLGKDVWLYDFLLWFEQGVMLFKHTDADSYDYDLGLSLITMTAVALLMAFIMSFTNARCRTYALGEDRELVNHIGFNVLKLQLFVYGHMGLMSGAAGAVQSWTVMTVAPDSLLGYELIILIAVIFGDISLPDGYDTLTGILLGVMLLAVTQNGLNLLGVSSC